VLLRHGTTRKRAEEILRNGPNPRFREPNGQLRGDGFSTAPFPRKLYNLGPPEAYARKKAKNWPNEGGPAILEFELPDDLARTIISRRWNQNGKALNLGDEIVFDVGFGIEQLLGVWPQLTKRILDVEGE
jgi:hypothetical protein